MPDISKHSPDDFLAAFREDPMNGPLALYAGAALDAAGRHEEAVVVWTFGDDANPVLRSIHKHPEANDDLRAHSLRADQAIRHHFTSLFQNTVDEFAKTLQKDTLDRARRGVYVQYAAQPFEYQTHKQRPVIFYMPDLPARPVTPTQMLDWAAPIEAAWQDIRAEFETAVAAKAEEFPYVAQDVEEPHWAGLRGKLDWAALYIHFNAELRDEAKYFPETIKALSNAPLVSRDGVPLETFFSRLKPGAHIPPHYGLTNTRLTVHLPLIVPVGCEIRVGEDLHQWSEGKITAFDDSFEHEAWNRGNADRVVLIFETHHPDLSKTEIEAIERVYEAMQKWVAGRADFIGLEVVEEPANSSGSAMGAAPQS